MFVAEQLLRSFLLPGLASLLLLLAARRFAFGHPAYAGLSALALAVGFGAGFAAIAGLPRLPAISAVDTLPWLALGSALAAFAMRSARAAELLPLLLCGLTALSLGLGRIKPQYAAQGFLDWPRGLFSIAICALLLIAGWRALAGAGGSRRAALLLPAVFAAAALAGALAQYLGHSGKLAQLQLTVSALALALLLSSLFGSKARAPRLHAPAAAGLLPAVLLPAVMLPAVMLLWLLHGGLLICGNLYSGLGELTALALGALPPLAALLLTRAGVSELRSNTES